MAKMDTRFKRIGKAIGLTSALILLKAIATYSRSPKQGEDIIQLIIARLPPTTVEEFYLYISAFIMIYFILLMFHWKRYPNSIPKLPIDLKRFLRI